MNEFIEQFLIECRELVEQGTDDLLLLEERPGDRERLDSAFRAFHTLKGAAGIVEFAAMESALHVAEDVLSTLRSGGPLITAAQVGDCLACLDQVLQWLDATEAAGEPPTDAQPAADAIIARFGQGAAPSTPAAETRLVEVLENGDLDAIARDLLREQAELLRQPELSPGHIASTLNVAGAVLRRLGRVDEATRLEGSGLSEAQPSRDAIESLIDGSLQLTAEGPAPAREAAEPAARSLRVALERIDALVNLTGELAVAKNALGHAATLARQGEAQALAPLLKEQHAELERLVAELQRSVLSIRVLPLRTVFQRFPRLVREMMVQLGKPVRLLTEGDGVEADKAIVENLFEPILHILRNALDHGVEPAEVRAAAGKPPSATISLRALRQGERVLIEIEDDGVGIDVAKVREVAVARGVASAEAVDAMDDTAVTDLIFSPGFSTASQVTAVSGRGVGMDAVRTAVERLGGRVAIDSRAGVGTTVRLMLPFTVIMTQVMTVEVGQQVFGIPMEALVETVRIPRERIAAVGTASAFVYRGRTVPLIDLSSALGQAACARGEEINIVIAQAGSELGGLEVDRLGERMDVMLKPMEGLLAGTPAVAGATFLGDGRVLIVLDLHQLLH